MAQVKTYHGEIIEASNPVSYFFKTAFEKINKHFEMVEAEAHLLDLDDRLLNDLGISRSDIKKAVHSGR